MTDDSPHPHTKKARQWIKARGTISPAGGHEAHLAALAYMSDSYFIGTIARVHKLWRYAAVRKSNTKSSIDEDVLKKLLAMEDEDLKRVRFLDQHDLERIRKLKNGEPEEPKEPKQEIGMMVSLDHTIYFHDPRGFRADEWMFTEMETPWSGDGRGLVFQKLFSKDGRLIATCVQEVVRNTSQLKPRLTASGRCAVTSGHRHREEQAVSSCRIPNSPFPNAFRCINFAPHRLHFNLVQFKANLSKRPQELVLRVHIAPAPAPDSPLLPDHLLQFHQTLLQLLVPSHLALAPLQILMSRPNRSFPPSTSLHSL